MVVDMDANVDSKLIFFCLKFGCLIGFAGEYGYYDKTYAILGSFDTSLVQCHLELERKQTILAHHWKSTGIQSSFQNFYPRYTISMKKVI